MPLRTELFTLLPWVGGVNTSINQSMIPKNQLTIADNVLFDTRGSRKKRDGINFNFDTETPGSDSIIGLHNFNFGSIIGKSRLLVAVTDADEIFSYTLGGTRSVDRFAGTAWGSAVTKASIVTINNQIIIAVDGAGNVIKSWDGIAGTVSDLAGTPPVGSILSQHLNRLWTNDKTNVDRLHYSTTANPTEWNGTGDSGAIDIGIGDGDPDGITAIFPTFQGDLFVAKKTKLYRISGLEPETFRVTLVSSGIGCVGHNAVAAIDQNDVYFISERGIHSLVTTANFGDFESKYISKDIQKTFNDNFTKIRLGNAWGAYLSEINSVAFAVTDNEFSAANNEVIWLYNIPLDSWYRWPQIPCESLITVSEGDRQRFYIGGSTTKIAKTFITGTNSDTNEAGIESAIVFRVQTGRIFVDDSPYTVKGFKKFSLIYGPEGTHTITVCLKIDNFPLQAIAFTNTSGDDLLGVDFVLGASVLGSAAVVSPFTQPIAGYGRGIRVTIEQAGVEEIVEIQGIAIEYETASTQQEVKLPA